MERTHLPRGLLRTSVSDVSFAAGSQRFVISNENCKLRRVLQCEDQRNKLIKAWLSFAFELNHLLWHKVL